MSATPERIIILNDISDAKGGATALALASALEFRQRGLAVTFLTGDDGDAPSLKAAGVEVVGLGQKRMLAGGALKAMATGIYNPQAAAMVRNWIEANDGPGVVYHLHGWAQIFSPSIFEALKPVANRLVLSAHDFFLVCPNGAFAFLKSGSPCSLKPMSLACITANCDRRNYGHKIWRVARQAVRDLVFDFGRYSPPVLAIHESMRPYLARGGIDPATITTLPNPVRPFLQARVQAESNREFVFIGRLEEGKGPDLACAAAELAGARLRIIGDGDMRQDLERRFKTVTFSGRKSYEEIGPLVANARALLMPSRYPEPYGLVAAEALWSGLPVVAADTAFLAEDIVAAGAGLAVAPRDTAAFASALTTLMDDDERLRSMSVNAYEATRSIGLTMEEWINRLLQAYSDRLASRGEHSVAIEGVAR